MRIKIRTVSIFAAFSFLVLCAATIISAQTNVRKDSPTTFTKVSDQAPPFAVTTLDNKKISLADLKGKIVFLNFWATWCPPCRVEMPRIEREIWQKYQAEQFAMIAIAREETIEDIKPFVQENKYTFPFAPDPKREIYGLFASEGIPRSYVFDPEGKIVYQSSGFSNQGFEQLKKAIEKELKKVKRTSKAVE